jgi:hypothetical protein
MDDKAFQELLENTRLAAAWLRGEDTASRITCVGEPDPRETRPGTRNEIPRAED